VSKGDAFGVLAADTICIGVPEPAGAFALIFDDAPNAPALLTLGFAFEFALAI
jgi:hypothetical protein